MTIEAVTTWLHDESQTSEQLSPGHEVVIGGVDLIVDLGIENGEHRYTMKDGPERLLRVVDSETVMVKELGSITNEELIFKGDEINKARFGFLPYPGMVNFQGEIIYKQQVAELQK